MIRGFFLAAGIGLFILLVIMVFRPSNPVDQVTQPLATIAANSEREANAAENQPVGNDGDSGSITSPTGMTRDQAAQIFGVNPEYLMPHRDNGWVVNSPSPVTVKVPQGWRIDFTDANYGIHSCGDIYSPGQYGPVEVNAVAATLWFVPGETACPPWSTNAQFGGKDDTRFNNETTQGEGGNDAAPTEEPQVQPTVAPSNGSTAADTTAPANAAAWTTLVGGYGEIISTADQYGGIQINLANPVDLPEGFMADGEDRKVGETGGERKLEAGVWTIYPPYEWREALGFAS
jgi:hypothetical protein